MEDQFTMVVTDSKGKSRTIKGNWKKHPNAKQKFDWTGKSVFRVLQEKRSRFEFKPEVHTFPVWKDMYRHVVNKSRKRHLFRTTEECPRSREGDHLGRCSNRWIPRSLRVISFVTIPQKAPMTCPAQSVGRSPVNRCPLVLA